MNYHIKFQNVHRWLTHISVVACNSLSQGCQWLSLVRETKFTKVLFKTRELVLASVAACDKTPALPPNLIIQWTEVRLTEANRHYWWSQDTKMISTPRKINAILLNIKLNQPKLESTCGYKLATNWQNFTDIYLA